MKKYVLILLASLAISCSPDPQQENRQKAKFSIEDYWAEASDYWAEASQVSAEAKDGRFLSYYYNLCIGGRGPFALLDETFTYGDRDRCSNFALKMLETRELSKGCRKND